MYNDDNLLIT